MDNHFKTLFALVDEVRQNVTEKESLQKESRKLRSRATELYNSVVERYQQERQQIVDRIEQAEKENERNKAEIVELTRQQIMTETSGGVFWEAERLESLKANVTTYPLKLEALERLKDDICIPAVDWQKIEAFQANGYNLLHQISGISEKLETLLADIKGDAVLNCLATLERVPSNCEFMAEQFKVLQSMRKEET